MKKIKTLSEMSLQEMDRLWEESKNISDEK
jgi:uncharacterized protein YabN with tetrapyrrole methylase and pyrophosphatase domain